MNNCFPPLPTSVSCLGLGLGAHTHDPAHLNCIRIHDFRSDMLETLSLEYWGLGIGAFPRKPDSQWARRDRPG